MRWISNLCWFVPWSSFTYILFKPHGFSTKIKLYSMTFSWLDSTLHGSKFSVLKWWKPESILIDFSYQEYLKSNNYWQYWQFFNENLTLFSNQIILSNFNQILKAEIVRKHPGGSFGKKFNPSHSEICFRTNPKKVLYLIWCKLVKNQSDLIWVDPSLDWSKPNQSEIEMIGIKSD